MIVCRYCLEELISRGEEITIEEQIHDAGHCAWCDEDDEELYRVSFERASARVGMDNAIKNTIYEVKHDRRSKKKSKCQV